MVRGLGFTAGLTVLIALVLLAPPTYCSNPPCAHSSSCGNIPNISFPFRLTSDPQNCGDSKYELSCDANNRTVLYLFEGRYKYYVQEISYSNYTIRIVDSSIHKDNYFSTPSNSLHRHNFNFDDPYSTYQLKQTVSGWYHELSRSLVWMSCEKPVNSPLYLDTSTCNYNDNSSSISDSKRYRYVAVGITRISEVEDSCQVEKMFLTSWPINNITCTDVHNELVNGFELSWFNRGGNCESYCGRNDTYCYLDEANHLQCERFDGIIADGLLGRIRYTLQGEIFGIQFGTMQNGGIKLKIQIIYSQPQMEE
ncbi:uncharacterized protein LOC126700696 [Quercus robur]|uniref:uncharacterized protein LOC126700696 n=1 Tax=Quercus robur TaxID=38942 RepID=UPI0021634E1D|nr:uncharacterized protein LOC126700696 [Quercus robur]